MKELTKRQAALLEYIQDFLLEHKFPPTFREIGDCFQISVRAAYDHIKALERKGIVTCDKNRSRSIEIVANEKVENLAAEEVLSIPRLGVVAAGIPILSEENCDGYITIPSSMLRPGTYFALDVRGESMINAGILDGDTAIIRQQVVAQNGDLVVAMIDEAVTLKRFVKEHNRIQLKAENPNFPSIFTREVKILGVVSQIIRSYS